MFHLYKASFCCLGKGHVYEGSGERLRVHLAARPLQVLDLPLLHVGAGGARPHREQVGHHAAEPRRQAGLGYETKLELGLENNTKTSHRVDKINIISTKHTTASLLSSNVGMFRRYDLLW